MLNALKEFFRNTVPRPIQAIIANSYVFIVRSRAPILNKAVFLAGAYLLGSCTITAAAAINFLAIAKIIAFANAALYFSELICVRKNTALINDVFWAIRALTNLRAIPSKVSEFFSARLGFWKLLGSGRLAYMYRNRFSRPMTIGISLLLYFSMFSYLRVDILLKNTGIFTPLFMQNITLMSLNYCTMALGGSQLLRVLIDMPYQPLPHALRRLRREIVDFTNCLLDEDVLDVGGPDDGLGGATSAEQYEHTAGAPRAAISALRAARLLPPNRFLATTAAASNSDAAQEEADTPTAIGVAGDLELSPGAPARTVPMNLGLSSHSHHSDNEGNHHGEDATPHNHSHSDSECASTQCASENLVRSLTVTNKETNEPVTLCGDSSTATAPVASPPRPARPHK